MNPIENRRKQESKELIDFHCKFDNSVCMAYIFTKRCKKALREKRISVSLPVCVRQRFLFILNDFNSSYYETTETGYNYTTNDLDKVEQQFKREHGFDTLKVYSDRPDQQRNIVNGNIEAFIQRGIQPQYIFDIIELFYKEMSQNGGIKHHAFQSSINEIFTEHNMEFRMADGEIFPVESQYIEEYILSKTHELLRTNSFHGAMDEFKRARASLINGECRDALNMANASFESNVKHIVGKNSLSPKQIAEELKNSGLIPNYLSKFTVFFVDKLLRSITLIRNEESAHGQGDEVKEIPIELAEFGVNLAGLFINYLIKRYISQNPTTVDPQPEESMTDLPPIDFEGTSDDDDIPF